MKTLSEQNFNQLKNFGSVVPRYRTTGEVIPFTVGKEYTFTFKGESITARCTQSAPYHLKLIPAHVPSHVAAI